MAPLAPRGAGAVFSRSAWSRKHERPLAIEAAVEVGVEVEVEVEVAVAVEVAVDVGPYS
jgi:hypothetical protein